MRNYWRERGLGIWSWYLVHKKGATIVFDLNRSKRLEVITIQYHIIVRLGRHHSYSSTTYRPGIASKKIETKEKFLRIKEKWSFALFPNLYVFVSIINISSYEYLSLSLSLSWLSASFLIFALMNLLLSFCQETREVD